MNKALKTYLLILGFLLVAVIAVELSSPPKIDWSRTYNETHKIPFGTYIFYNELKEIYPDAEIQDIADTPYEFFDANYDWDAGEYNIYGSYVYIDESMTIDDVSAQELLDYVSYGNDAFISSSSLPFKFIDSLKISLSNEYNIQGTAQLKLANKRLARDSVMIERGLNNLYFSSVDTLNTTVLGYQRVNDKEQVNFIKVRYIQGDFYIHLQPMVFTNYSLLKEDHKNYTEAVLAYLDPEYLYFDSRNKKRLAMGDSPLRFILATPALKWAFYLGLIGLIIFISFNAKRRQRIVPIKKPLRNTTIDFTKTIANLYYETKDHTTLIDKKITYFLEFIRRTYLMDTEKLDEKFIEKLAAKSGKKISEVKKLINLITYLNSKRICTEADLVNLNKQIENFHKH